MHKEEQNKKQHELEEIVKGLSHAPLDEQGIRETAIKLCRIYNNSFRHNYSTFFPLILEIAQRDDESSLEYLSNNMGSLKSFVEEDFAQRINEFNVLYDPLEKLSDHLNLEIGRWNYYSKNESKIRNLEERMNTAGEELTEATQLLEQASKQAASIQTELITVLSIFAAIVITLSGGFTFLGSVMTSISGVTYIEAVVLVAIICGMTIFNTIFLMMYLVGKITGRSIFARCPTANCTCSEQQTDCTGIKRIKKRLPYVFYFNFAAIVGIIINGIVWIIDINCVYF